MGEFPFQLLLTRSGNKLVGNKRIFLITDDDEPQGSLGNRQPARTTYNVSLSFELANS